MYYLFRKRWGNYDLPLLKKGWWTPFQPILHALLCGISVVWGRRRCGSFSKKGQSTDFPPTETLSLKVSYFIFAHWFFSFLFFSINKLKLGFNFDPLAQIHCGFRPCHCMYDLSPVLNVWDEWERNQDPFSSLSVSSSSCWLCRNQWEV